MKLSGHCILVWHSGMAFMKLDLADASLHKETGKVDIGFIADKSLKDSFRAKKCTDKNAFSIRAERKKFLITLLSKLQENSPLKYTLVRNLGWLIPN